MADLGSLIMSSSLLSRDSSRLSAPSDMIAGPLGSKRNQKKNLVVFSREVSQRELFVRGPHAAPGWQPTQTASQQEPGCPTKRKNIPKKKEREIPKNVSKRARARLAWSSSRAEGGNRPLTGTHLNSSNSAAKFGR